MQMSARSRHGSDYRRGRRISWNPVDVDGMNAYQLMDRTISIMQWEMTKFRREEADVMLVPEVLFVKGRFQTTQAGDCIEEGRRVVKEAMPRIRTLMKE